MNQKGFIRTILLVIVGLALLKYFFNWSIFDAAASEQGRNTIGYIRDLLNTLWSYIETPVLFVWSKILWPLLNFVWQAFQDLIEWGKHGGNAPIIPTRY